MSHNLVHMFNPQEVSLHVSFFKCSTMAHVSFKSMMFVNQMNTGEISKASIRAKINQAFTQGKRET